MNARPNSSRVSFENPKAWPHSGSFSTNNPQETDSTAVRPWESFKSCYRRQNLVVYFYHHSFYKFSKSLLQLTSQRKQSAGVPAQYSTVCDSQEALMWGSASVKTSTFILQRGLQDWLVLFDLQQKLTVFSFEKDTSVCVALTGRWWEVNIILKHLASMTWPSFTWRQEGL